MNKMNKSGPKFLSWGIPEQVMYIEALKWYILFSIDEVACQKCHQII